MGDQVASGRLTLEGTHENKNLMKSPNEGNEFDEKKIWLWECLALLIKKEIKTNLQSWRNIKLEFNVFWFLITMWNQQFDEGKC